MLRSSLTTAGMVLLGASAFAQTDGATRMRPITGPVRDAGVYHVETNTWTRKASVANLGADIIYNNTCLSGYYSPLDDDTYVDEGRIPSPTSPSNLTSRPGCTTSYLIEGVQIAYCCDQPTPGTYTVAFFEAYTQCATVIGVTPTASFALAGLPGGGVGGGMNCWIVTLDVAPAGPLSAFTMLADGNGSFTGSDTANRFGWSMSSSLGVLAAATGPIIAGNPSICARYDGTRWDSPIDYTEEGTGMTNGDAFRIEGGATTPPGCYWFLGDPFAGFHLELYANACVPTEPGVSFCPGDGTGTACPCANNSVAGAGEGCLSSISPTLGGRLRATGTASISADTVVLNGTQMPNSSALYYQGTVQQNGGNGTAFGDGKRCAGGTIVRLGTKVNSSGASAYPVGADPRIALRGLVTVPGTRTYQVWYRNAAAFCTASTFNLTNGYQIAWGV